MRIELINEIVNDVKNSLKEDFEDGEDFMKGKNNEDFVCWLFDGCNENYISSKYEYSIDKEESEDKEILRDLEKYNFMCEDDFNEDENEYFIKELEKLNIYEKEKINYID